MATDHTDYAILAARIAVSNLHKNTDKSFSKTMYDLHQYIDPKTGAVVEFIVPREDVLIVPAETF